jgi:hypothetical protein
MNTGVANFTLFFGLEIKVKIFRHEIFDLNFHSKKYGTSSVLYFFCSVKKRESGFRNF